MCNHGARPLPASREPVLTFSVVIPNYNYADYLPAAIESALALEWPSVQVIVVDDGSTDASRGILDVYRDRVEVVLQDNQGQLRACNVGYERARGDVVLFLDSDDVVDSRLAARVAEVWYPGVSKVQVQMQQIGSDGEPKGRAFPHFRHRPSPQLIEQWYRRTSAYPTPPGSGNVYSRGFLDGVMPAGEDTDTFLDSYLLALAPLCGDVVTLREPLVHYRVHGRNDSDVLADPSRFGREVERAVRRWTTAMRAREPHSPPSLEPLFRSREVLQFRVAAHRNRSGADALPGDSRCRLLLDVLTAPLHPGPESAAHRMAITAWCLAVMWSPRSVARWLVRRRYQR